MAKKKNLEEKEYKKLVKDLKKIIGGFQKEVKKFGFEQCPLCDSFCDYKIINRKGKKVKEYYCPDCEKKFYHSYLNP